MLVTDLRYPLQGMGPGGKASLPTGLLLDWSVTRDDHARIAELIYEEVPRLYPDSERMAEQILAAAAVGSMGPFAATSLRKQLLLARSRDEVIGLTVATPKASGSVKFGPTVVAARWRRRRLAESLRHFGEAHFLERGYRSFYSTCRGDNLPAQAYVVNAGYRLVAKLRGQYSPGVVEYVFRKEVGSRQRALVSESYGFSPKRGGAVRIALPLSGREPLKDMRELIEDALWSQRSARRLYSWVPTGNLSYIMVRDYGFELESISGDRSLLSHLRD